MTTLAGIRMLVKRGAIEIAEPVWIIGKMARHPVDEHAQTGGMTGVDQGSEISRRSKAAGRREQARRLVAPGAVEGMLADRQKFDMGEAEVAGIRG